MESLFYADFDVYWIDDSIDDCDIAKQQPIIAAIKDSWPIRS